MSDLVRSLLFVPADQPRKIARALGSGADAVILDLEDSVAASAKPAARSDAAAALRAHGSAAPLLWVRINPLPSGLALDDLAAVMPAGPFGIMLPKCAGPADIARLGHWLDAFEAANGHAPEATRILPVATETPASLFALGDYASASPRLWGLTWGAEDLATALGATSNRAPDGSLAPVFRLARALCLAGAHAAGVAAIETLHADYRDPDAAGGQASQARREGFTGMLAIHPDQVGPINAAFMPTEAETAYAHRVIEAFAAAPGAGAVGLDGRMLDAPHLAQARAILRRAERRPAGATSSAASGC